VVAGALSNPINPPASLTPTAAFVAPATAAAHAAVAFHASGPSPPTAACCSTSGTSVTASSQSTHYLRVYMDNLRQKLEDDSAQPRHIVTETGVGYRLLVD